MENMVLLAAKMSIGEAGITAIFGYLVVFVGLALLMGVIYLIGAIFQANVKKKEAVTAVQASAAESIVPEKPAAPGSAGHVKRFDVPDKEAAMIMAVVAYQMKKPLNELRFISIKEVKEDEV
ncbi:MAG: OadG family protein [Oscillospiraceae bacterium]|nr:OadG family protein [Oscillospiraceae bacterium]